MLKAILQMTTDLIIANFCTTFHGPGNSVGLTLQQKGFRTVQRQHEVYAGTLEGHMENSPFMQLTDSCQ